MIVLEICVRALTRSEYSLFFGSQEERGLDRKVAGFITIPQI